MPGTLIAGFGNALRGDDGFGVEVVRRLGEADLDPDVELVEIGTGGIRLPQELLRGYDRLIIVDAMTRGGPPGSVYVRAVDSVERITEIDMHLTLPSRALSVAQALGALPPRVYLVGCEPAEADELSLELSPRVSAAVEVALERIRELLAHDGPAVAAGGADV